MAFNPFHKFRKHQKAIFAALTIMCMVIFVLGPSSGALMQGGDFFSNLSRWVTGKARQTDVATLNGKGISPTDLREVALKRKMANQFMDIAFRIVMQGVNAEMQTAMSAHSNPRDPQGMPAFNSYIQLREIAQRS